MWQVQLAGNGGRQGPAKAVKLHVPAGAAERATGAWEFYALRALAGRAGSAHERALFVAPDALVLGENASALLLPLGSRGTLQALLNVHLGAGQVGKEG